MTAANDYAGRQFGRWLVVSRAEVPGARRAHWNVRCVCGSEAVVQGQDLRDGRSTGCRGCAVRSGRPPLPNEQVGYETVHRRLKQERGSARDQLCFCGKSADSWAYQHDDPDERIELVKIKGKHYPMRFSPNLDAYAPMCSLHHRELDNARREVIRG